MSFEEDKPMSFEEYAKWIDNLTGKGKGWLEKALQEHYRGMKDEQRINEVSGSLYQRAIPNEELEQDLQNYPLLKKSWDKISELRTEIDDEEERVKRLGALKYGKHNYRRSAQMHHINMEDLRLTDADMKSLGYSEDGKLVVTIQLTRTKYAEEKDPPSEEVDPMRIAWVKSYTYSPQYQTGIMILFNNGEFKSYTQSFEYFKHKVQQFVGNMVLIGGKLPNLPWWGES
jgi:hypothetical protein